MRGGFIYARIKTFLKLEIRLDEGYNFGTVNEFFRALGFGKDRFF
ncbi:hypothetical protein LEP1GSC171_3290 [Leptospira santarosai str. HAI1380]|uniref:Uncharacterized protein n=2 Tax=Leptospira santarosai TaxID=28183 RepID=M6UWG3_9LEPT|nr:hypothetical protein LEP1GSC068_1099 [Leptospira sp. Fiocruz LV3954]EKT88488.1 hypothetical protein LSS_01662 [Leptospira santarosai serovar Shermani str. LT 821]EMF90556.1 hypothetical protein LEP1GSC005_2851 [Leptospira santarosai str. ST188]EMI66002.1 hypothetical protein LEP1GSC076_3346 [Leptospira sp. Fiocruz LV4135]EMJ50530.1 hypothetical protein LEP1GSC169_2488 [Leptospira santarosai str. HAI1349]EMM88210.1 hypothetical protein LEP1GSC039_3388 [Leptospira santarosai str. 2000027870]